MLETILPAGVDSEERVGASSGGWLFPEEQLIVAGAVESRRTEYATVRACARACLERLGYHAVPILPGIAGQPAWPSGVRGSMTHCAGYTAAAVGRSDRVAAIGIDAEPDEPLPDGVLDLVATPAERDRLTRTLSPRGGPCADRLLFSAKEAVYKTWFPLVGDWLDPLETEIAFEPLTDAFTATLERDGLTVDGSPVHNIHGRWTRGHGIIVTAAVIRGSDSTAAVDQR